MRIPNFDLPRFSLTLSKTLVKTLSTAVGVVLVSGSLIGATQANAAGSSQTNAAGTQEAVFAGGCFWCMEEAFDKVKGVVSTTSGYTGGRTQDPSYEQVTGGNTGHAEALEVEYDPEQVSYDELLRIFWRNIDPFAENRQFCDQGNSYRSAIFPTTAEQNDKAEASHEAVSKRFDQDIATRIEDFSTFYPAEDYHQNYYKKNPLRYRFYKSACGRVERLEEVWGEEAGGVTADGQALAGG